MKGLSYLKNQIKNLKYFIIYKRFGKLIWIRLINDYILFCSKCGEYICSDGFCSNPICPEKINDNEGWNE